MQAWELFLQKQERELGQETVKKWLRSLKVVRYDACNLYLEAKDTFQALWFEEHMRAIAQAKLLNGNHKRIKVHLSVADAAVNANAEAKKKLSQTKGKKENKGAQFQLAFDHLDPLFLFRHFIPGKHNEVTHKILSEVAGLASSKPSTIASDNPIYLYGPSGSGKTHLLMSLAQSFLARKLKTLYVRAELFTDHVVTAIRAGEMRTFRQAYRNADVLIVDDVHVFSRKGVTQEEFFHTFNTLHLEGKQIILSANCPPQELQLIEPRLVSRFEWGIVLPLKLLDGEELNEILQAKMQAMQVALPSKVLNFLNETFVSNPKALIKALQALVLRLHGNPQYTFQNLSIVTLKSLLSDLIAEEQKSALTPAKIVQSIADYYGIRSDDIFGKSQTRECALPRQLAMHFCRDKLKMPYMKIGDLFSRDHSTVMSSVKHINKSLEEDNVEIGSAWQAILKKLQA